MTAMSITPEGVQKLLDWNCREHQDDVLGGNAPSFRWSWIPPNNGKLPLTGKDLEAALKLQRMPKEQS
jgi:hypothetical protein